MTTKSSLIAVILDRSGSMESIRDDTIGGFNAFLDEQKRLGGDCRLSLVQFDTLYEPIHQNLPINEVPALTRETFVPRGGTALLDAIGRTLTTLESDLVQLEREGKKPEKIYVVVITDGQENSSSGEYTRERIFQMIEDRRKNSCWEFLFLASNQDAIVSGQSYGFSADSSISYCSGSTSEAYGVISGTISGSRATGKSISFTSEQRNTAMGK